MQAAYINANGLNQIAAALARFHKQDHFTESMLSAWAADAEQSFLDGNDMAFEIKSWDSVSGHTEEVVITAEGYDIQSLVDDE